MGGGDDGKLQATTQANLEEELEVNIDQVIEYIQVELVKPIEYVVIIVEVKKPIVVIIDIS